jgi:light-regulated signal transduction histidine kinase (bacteriophytochrome)
LHKDTWEQWSTGHTPFSSEQIADFKKGLEEVNARLEKVGRALGHRVWQSVEQYMLNYPKVIEARQETAADRNNDENGDQAEQNQQDKEELIREMRKAFEDQVVQKVMPKLRGIETRGQARKDCLDPIREVLVDELALDLERDFDLACDSGQGRFVWNSAHYMTSE